jgi:hypothetical protein
LYREIRLEALQRRPETFNSTFEAEAGWALERFADRLGASAIFTVVTPDGTIVQEHMRKGLDGLAPPGNVRRILGVDGNAQDEANEPRFGVIMNRGVVRQLFVSEPFYNTIAIVNLTVFGTAPNQVFGLGPVIRIGSLALNLPVDRAPVERDREDVNWASNTTLDQGSDFYIANQGDNTIVRMTQGGTVMAHHRQRPVRPVALSRGEHGVADQRSGRVHERVHPIFSVFCPKASGLLSPSISKRRESTFAAPQEREEVKVGPPATAQDGDNIEAWG